MAHVHVTVFVTLNDTIQMIQLDTAALQVAPNLHAGLSPDTLDGDVLLVNPALTLAVLAESRNPTPPPPAE